MSGRRASANSRADQLGRLIDVACGRGLTIYEIVVEPKSFRLRTQPLGESAPAEDAADRWLREQGDAGKAGRGA